MRRKWLPSAKLRHQRKFTGNFCSYSCATLIRPPQYTMLVTGFLHIVPTHPITFPIKSWPRKVQWLFSKGLVLPPVALPVPDEPAGPPPPAALPAALASIVVVHSSVGSATRPRARSYLPVVASRRTLRFEPESSGASRSPGHGSSPDAAHAIFSKASERVAVPPGHCEPESARYI